jgi:FKBP-type peptidyl-prolyl cis-trans isomerase
MRKFSFLCLGVIFLVSCKQDFQKGPKGLEYKIISNGNGTSMKYGDFMQMQIAQYINNGKTDSLMSDTRTSSGAVVQPLDSMSIPPDYYKIISKMKKGDSLVLRMLADSLIAQNPGGMPPFIKKGYYLLTTVKLLNVFKNEADADKARKAEMIIQRAKDSVANIELLKQDDKAIQDYLKKNKITAKRAPLGTYVQILQLGTGAQLDTSVVVKVNYTGRTMDGKVFDSNTDPSKSHVEPFLVNLTDDKSLGSGVINGWYDGLKMLSKGAKAKFFIPSTLAYGKQGAGADIKPNSILMFDIDVVDVLSKEQAKGEAEKVQKERMAKQKKFLDSMKNAMPDSVKKKMKRN